jgi:hypothetical protein
MSASVFRRAASASPASGSARGKPESVPRMAEFGSRLAESASGSVEFAFTAANFARQWLTSASAATGSASFRPSIVSRLTALVSRPPASARERNVSGTALPETSRRRQVSIRFGPGYAPNTTHPITRTPGHPSPGRSPESQQNSRSRQRCRDDGPWCGISR